MSDSDGGSYPNGSSGSDDSVAADDDNLSILSSELQDQFELLNLREDGIDFNRNRRND